MLESAVEPLSFTKNLTLQTDWRQFSPGEGKHRAPELLRRFLNRFSESRCLSEMLGSTEFFERVYAADNFGLSLGGALLYAQCGNSAARQPGAMVLGRGYTFGLGIYQVDDLLTAHIVGPSGPSWATALPEYCYWLLKSGADRVYVRHLPACEASRLSSAVFLDPREQFGWCAEAPYEEDETYNHRRLKLSDLVQFRGDEVDIQSLNGVESKNFRNKFRHAYARFQNFLSRNDLTFELVPIQNAQQVCSGKSLVDRHFAHLENAGRAIGSTALDYEQLLNHSPANSDRHVSLVGQLRRKDSCALPISVFLGERTSPTNGGLYCTITDRDVEFVKGQLGPMDSRGFTAIGQYVFARVFAYLLTRGWKTVDLGGSETAELDRFKQQLGCEKCRVYGECVRPGSLMLSVL